MPGRRGTERRRLGGNPLNVRFTSEVRAAIDIAAGAAGITAASWIRELAVHELGAPPDHTVPVKAYEPPAPPPSKAVLDLVDLRHLVRETNGNLTRLAVTARGLGYDDLHSELGASLAAVGAAVRRIDELKLRILGAERGARAA